MHDQPDDDDDLPLLTEVIEAAPEPPVGLDEAQLAELQTRLTASTYELAERLLHAAFSEMEATVFEHVANRLRQELPDLVDRVLREHFEHHPGDEPR